MTTTSDAVEAAYTRLPGPRFRIDAGSGGSVPGFSAMQMRAYADATIAHRAALDPPQPGAILDAGGQESGHLAAPGSLSSASEFDALIESSLAIWFDPAREGLENRMRAVLSAALSTSATSGKDGV